MLRIYEIIYANCGVENSLRSTGAGEETREVTPRVSPSRAPVFSGAHYFQAPATQARQRTI